MSIIGIVGELLISAGVLVLLFLGWQLWLNNIIAGSAQHKAAVEQSQTWDKGEATAPATVDRADPGVPVVLPEPGDDVTFGNLIIPRFGSDYTRPIAEGVAVHGALADGIGHYVGTQMPGVIGNVALAGHRTGWGQPFFDIANLRVGDSIYIETSDGWYRYVFRSLEYVMPTGVDVLDAVPSSPGITSTDRILTLTSCNPKTTAAERIIMYSVFDTWYPRAGGPPPEIAALVQASAAG